MSTIRAVTDEGLVEELVSPEPNHSHYSYTIYADPATAEEFDQTRFGGQIGQLVATAQERVLDECLGDMHGKTALDVGSGTDRKSVV